MGLSLWNYRTAALDGIELAREVVCRARVTGSIYSFGYSWLVQCSVRVETMAYYFGRADHAFYAEHSPCSCLGKCLKTFYESKFSNARCADCFLGYAGHMAYDVSGAFLLAVFDGGKCVVNFHLFQASSIPSRVYVCSLFDNVGRRIFSVALV